MKRLAGKARPRQDAAKTSTAAEKARTQRLRGNDSAIEIIRACSFVALFGVGAILILTGLSAWAAVGQTAAFPASVPG